MASPTLSPLFPNLHLGLPDPLIPWTISSETFAKMTATQDIPYKITQLFPTDPEWAFVWHHFHHQKPTKYSLGKVLIIHERHQQQAFEQNLSRQEKEASKFPPNWDQEPRAPQRAQAIQRWKETTVQFSPFESMETDGRRNTWEAVKVLTLFHGTRKEICHSICESGHVYFGNKSLSKNPGDPISTDDGYFGKGIYFTNSARYAADIYSQGHLLISWVSMREPFPFVGDPTQEDMRILRGQGAYKHYNTHYVPVTSLDPTNPNCPEYYPTQETQLPTYDEYVVFQTAQTLPRFWLHLVVDALFLKTLSAHPQNIEELIPHLMLILQNPHVDADKKVRNYLNEKFSYLLHQPADDYLDDHDLSTFHTQLQTLIDATGKVNRASAKALMGGPAPALAAAPLQASSQYESDLVRALAESLKLSVQAPTPIKPPVAVPKPLPIQPQLALPPMAFGRAKWEQYFSIQVIEPPLPPDIDKILAGACPIFPGKKVADTHFLKLIPEGMTLERLEGLTQNPKQGNKMGFRDKGTAWAQHGKTPSGRAHWVLMTNDVIPDSGSKNWKDQQALAAKFKGKGYELLSGIDAATCLLLEYVETGRRCYSDNPYTYTRCVEQVESESSQWPLTIGGFAPGGVFVYYFDGGVGSSGVGLARQFR